MWLTLTKTKCLTPSHHTRIHPIQPPNPHPFIPLHSKTQTPCLLPFPQHSTSDPNVAPWENALAKALARLKTWSKRNLSIHNRALIVRTMILPTVDYVLSAAPAPTRALCLLERNITQFLWDGPDGNRWRPMVNRATLARPHINGGLNCPLVKDIADSRRVALWTRALYSTQDWACALKKRVLDETGVNGTAFLHKRIPSTNHAQQIIAAFKRLRWAFPDDAIPHGLKKYEQLLTRSFLSCGHIDSHINPTHFHSLSRLRHQKPHASNLESVRMKSDWFTT